MLQRRDHLHSATLCYIHMETESLTLKNSVGTKTADEKDHMKGIQMSRKRNIVTMLASALVLVVLLVFVSSYGTLAKSMHPLHRALSQNPYCYFNQPIVTASPTNQSVVESYGVAETISWQCGDTKIGALIAITWGDGSTDSITVYNCDNCSHTFYHTYSSSGNYKGYGEDDHSGGRAISNFFYVTVSNKCC